MFESLRSIFAPETVANATRWVVVDVETTGLDPHRAELLAIAALAVVPDFAGRSLALCPQDSFEVVLERQSEAADEDNVLLHGIGLGSQRAGVPPGQALAAFQTWLGNSPLLAFHAGFDQTLINRHSLKHLGQALPNPWVCIEELCAATHTQVKARALDDWLAHFQIPCVKRHQAASDTWAEAEVLQRIWPQAATQCRDWHGLAKLASAARWVRGR